MHRRPAVFWQHPFHLPSSVLLFLPRWSLGIPQSQWLTLITNSFSHKRLINLANYRSLLIWSPFSDVFCRRSETCTTSSWWASGERRRWRCLMMTWRTLSTAKTQRTQVPHAYTLDHSLDLSEWEIHARLGMSHREHFKLQMDRCDSVYLTSICWTRNNQSASHFLDWLDKKVLIWQPKRRTCTSLSTYYSPLQSYTVITWDPCVVKNKNTGGRICMLCSLHLLLPFNHSDRYRLLVWQFP